MLLAVLASIACAIPVVVAVALAGGGESGAGTAAVAVSYPVLFGAMWWFSRRLSRRYGTGDMGRDYGWRRFRRADIGWGVLAGFVALVAQGIVGSIFKPDDSGYRDAVVGKHPSVLLLVLMGLATVVGAPLFEELMFRGPIMQSLLSRLGEWGGVVVQGVVFALYHVTGAPQLITLWYLTPLFVVGVIFGFAAHRTGRLATSQIAHATMNTLAYLALLASL